MKRIIFKSLAIFLATAVLSCTSTTETSNQTATTAEPIETDVSTDANDADLVQETEVSYDAIFSEVEDTEDYDILTLARMDDNFSTFVDLLDQSGLDVSLIMTDKVTVFLPTNAAFEEMSRERYEQLTDPQNNAELASLIQFHILPNEVATSQFNSNQVIETSGGKSAAVTETLDGGGISIGGANIVKGDIQASNGTIHVVDGVFEAQESTDIGVGTN